MEKNFIKDNIEVELSCGGYFHTLRWAALWYSHGHISIIDSHKAS